MKTKTRATELDKDVDRLSELLEGLGRRAPLRDPIARAVESMGLTPQQLHTVMWLSREGRLTMGTLAQRLGITEKTVTGLVDRLERNGCVERVRDEADRRVVHVCLAERGLAVARKLEASFRVRMRAMLEVLESRDREDLFRILGVLLDKADLLVAATSEKE